MTYYKFSSEIEPGIIGNVHGIQSEGMTPGYEINAPNSVWAIHKKGFDFKNLDQINLDSILLKHKAKLTDVISYVNPNSSLTIIADIRFMGFLKNFNIPDHKIVKCGIVKESTNEFVEDYFLFGLLNNQFDEINYSQSKFITGSNKSWPIEYQNVIVNSSKELEILLDKISFEMRLEFEKITFKSTFQYDLFRLFPLGAHFVSDTLKSAIEKGGFTGIRFEEAPNIVIDN